MRKFFILTIAAVALMAPSISHAETALEQLQQTANNSESFDGGPGSTLNAPAESTDYQGQGTWNAEANS